MEGRLIPKESERCGNTDCLDKVYSRAEPRMNLLPLLGLAAVFGLRAGRRWYEDDPRPYLSKLRQDSLRW